MLMALKSNDVAISPKNTRIVISPRNGNVLCISLFSSHCGQETTILNALPALLRLRHCSDSVEQTAAMLMTWTMVQTFELSVSYEYTTAMLDLVDIRFILLGFLLTTSHVSHKTSELVACEEQQNPTALATATALRQISIAVLILIPHAIQAKSMNM
jgi:hypothetical protein